MSVVLGACIVLEVMLFFVAWFFRSAVWWAWPFGAGIFLAAAWGVLEKDFICRSKSQGKNPPHFFFALGAWVICVFLFVFTYAHSAERCSFYVSTALALTNSVVVFNGLFELMSYENNHGV